VRGEELEEGLGQGDPPLSLILHVGGAGAMGPASLTLHEGGAGATDPPSSRGVGNCDMKEGGGARAMINQLRTQYFSTSSHLTVNRRHSYILYGHVLRSCKIRSGYKSGSSPCKI